jgi:FkbM family methyltransferase
MLTICPVQGAKIAVPSGDWMLRGLEEGREYEPYVLQAFLEKVTGHNVLDIGANVGIFTVLAARTAKSVIAVEPSPENAKTIAANVALNGLGNVTIFPAAISDKFEMATFLAEPSSNKVVRPMDIRHDTLSKVDVAMAVPVDALIDRKIDVVKIDVEGREHACLKGADRLFSMRPAVFTEYSPNFIKDGCGVAGSDYLGLFFSRGYAATILHRDMTREAADAALIHSRWQEYMSRQVTHLDLMMRPM